MLPYNIILNGKTVLVTGVAGFIGSNLAKRLLTDYAELKVISSAFITFWKPVDTVTIMGRQELNIWFTPPHPAYTARIKRYPIRPMIKLIIRYRYTPQPKSRMNCWRTRTPNYITYLQPDYDSLRYMAPQDVLIWPTSDLRTSL